MPLRYWSPNGGQKIHIMFFTGEAIFLTIKWGSTKNIYLPNTFLSTRPESWFAPLCQELHLAIYSAVLGHFVGKIYEPANPFTRRTQMTNPKYFLYLRPNLLGILSSDELHLFQCVMLLICMVFQFYCQKVCILIHFNVHIVCRVSTILNCNNISYNFNYNSTWGHLHDI